MALPPNLSAASLELKMKIDQTYANFFAAVAELQSIEDIFAGVEQTLFIEPTGYSSPENLQEKIAELREATNQPSLDASDKPQIETRLFDDLDLWRKALQERDGTLTTSDFCSYCLTEQPLLDGSVYASLAGFYRTLPLSVSVLSKFDFVVTQFFSRQLDNNRRAIRFESKKIVEELNRLNHHWTGTEFAAAPLVKHQIHKPLLMLSKLSAQAKSYKTLESWSENNFLDCFRQAKYNLNETFVVPEVTAGIIICNLVVGNHFASLCETDKAAEADALFLGEKEEKNKNLILDGPLSQVLIYANFDNDFAKEPEREAVNSHKSEDKAGIQREASFVSQLPRSNKTSSLSNHESLTEAPAAVAPQNNLFDEQLSNLATFDKSQEMTANSDVVTQKTINRSLSLDNVLAQLANENPDRELIKNYLHQSATVQIKVLNFEQFLDVDQNAESKYVTEALKLIIRAEDAVRTVVNAEGSLSRKFQAEASHLLEEIQTVNNNLRRLMSETVSARGEDTSPHQYFETLLYATNMLVESQLKLNSAIVRWQSKEEERLAKKNQGVEQNQALTEQNSNLQHNITLDHQVYETAAPLKLPQINLLIKNAPNKWLMIAGLAVIVLAFGWFVLLPKNVATPVGTTNALSLDPRLMIGGSNLNKARVSKNTLFGFVNSEWEGQNPQQKRDNLRLLLEEGSKYGYNNVLLINQKGDLVGNATKSEINLR